MIAAVVKSLAGWKGSAAALAAAALLVAGVVLERQRYGVRQYEAGVRHTRLEADARARQIEAQYRRQEQELAADYAARLEQALESVRQSSAERDRAAGVADGLRGAIAAQRARAAQAAARAGLSEQAAARAWDIFKACADEYAALARDADAAIDGMREGAAWAQAAAKIRP